MGNDVGECVDQPGQQRWDAATIIESDVYGSNEGNSEIDDDSLATRLSRNDPIINRPGKMVANRSQVETAATNG